jgi:hypothetical protein
MPPPPPMNKLQRWRCTPWCPETQRRVRAKALRNSTRALRCGSWQTGGAQRKMTLKTSFNTSFQTHPPLGSAGLPSMCAQQK